MAVDALKVLINQLDAEGTGTLDQTQWIKLCANEKININSELALQLFQGLNVDRKGYLSTADLLKELSAWEGNTERRTSIATARAESKLSLNGQYQGDVNDPQAVFDRIDSALPTSPGIDMARKPSKGHAAVKRRYPPGRRKHFFNNVIEDEAFGGYDSLDDAYNWRASREFTPDGTEVITESTKLIDPRLKRLADFESNLSQSYPELISPFSSVVKDLKLELAASNSDRQLLEQTYDRQRTDHQKELVRMEEEVENEYKRLQELQRNQEKGQTEQSIYAKQNEIHDLQSQLEDLRAYVNDKTAMIPDSTSSKREPHYSLTPEENRRVSHLQTTLSHREAELGLLKQKMAMQDERIFNDEEELRKHEQDKNELVSELRRQQETIQMLNSDFDDLASRTNSGSHAPNSDNSTENSRPPERMYKVILIGDSGVGKTSFMHRFCDDNFFPHLRATVGVDFQIKNVVVDEKLFTIQLWDTAGQEKFRSMVRAYFRKVDGVILIYDVGVPSSFAHIRSWVAHIEESSVSGHRPPLIIVGNKIDLRDREFPAVQSTTAYVSTEVGKSLATSVDAMFQEVSVKNGLNVYDVVQTLSREMKLDEDTKIGIVDIEQSPKYNRKRKFDCCT